MLKIFLIFIIFLQINFAFAGINWQEFSSAVIVEIKKDHGLFTCSGLAIERDKVLTSAHCVHGMQKVRVLWGARYNPKMNGIRSKEIIVHDGYNPELSKYKNDIAIIYLAYKLPRFVGHTQIGKYLNLAPTTPLERIGLGGRAGANIKTWTNPSFIAYAQNELALVATDLFAVKGDSGGPVFYRDLNDKLWAVGLHSTLEGTSRTYAVDLRYFVDWISSIHK